MNKCDFTYNWYENLISLLYSNHYTLTDYHEYQNHRKPCILRHDVDMDINKAAVFASYEAEFLKMGDNKGSTYFILLNSDFYNIFSKNSLNAAERILSLGNKIGLHFDEVKYNFNQDKKLFIEYVEQELDLISKALGTRIQVVSMHRPSTFTLKSNFNFKGAMNSYSEEFFHDFKYISDSRMNWREDAVDIIQNNVADKLHILTHPFWYNIDIENTRDKLLQFIKNSGKERYDNLSCNFKDLEEFVRTEDIE